MDARIFWCGVAVPSVLLVGLFVLGVMNAGQTQEDIADIKYMVLRLKVGLEEVIDKHEDLKSEMERITSELPGPAAAAGRAREALHKHFHALDSPESYDRHVIDYALESAGARVVDTGDSVDYVIYDSSVSYLLHCLAALLCKECINARAMISPGTLPGQCWAFKGHKGEATVRLLGTVYVTGVSLEHISPNISPTREISMAPRHFQLEGLERKTDMYPHDFGTFEYNIDGKPIQYFQVKNPSPKGHFLVRVKILSNWGNPVYTCVYRVRIHGQLTPGQLPYPVAEPPESSDELRL